MATTKRVVKKKVQPASKKAGFANMAEAGTLFCKVKSGKNKGVRSKRAKC